jgi:hypothetical protein
MFEMLLVSRVAAFFNAFLTSGRTRTFRTAVFLSGISHLAGSNGVLTQLCSKSKNYVKREFLQKQAVEYQTNSDDALKLISRGRMQPHWDRSGIPPADPIPIRTPMKLQHPTSASLAGGATFGRRLQIFSIALPEACPTSGRPRSP